MDKTNSLSSYAIPVAIVIGFGLIAGAIYFSGAVAGTSTDTDGNGTSLTTADSSGPEAINPVTEDDYIRGNPNAPIVLVEYSDFDCPFCKQFHETMQQIMAEYGQEGKVAWVYRQFPLEQLHPNAPRLALASECVGHLGGNDAFWKYADQVFGERGTNEQTNINRLSEFAQNAGVDETTFNDCFSSDRYQADVEADFNNAIAIGGRGTPHTIIMVGDQQGVINGAQPYNVVKQIIENLLGQIEGGSQ